ELNDPLLHMIRNSMDHGIEPAADRVASGKPARGTLRLAAYHQGGSIVVEIADDGRGLQLDKLRRKAIESGRHKPEEVEKWDAQTVAGMIFVPGISTADATTLNAGRGVGMDIIQQKVESLGGKVDVRFESGVFCEFAITLPGEAGVK
ncbi:MAG TPA: ATP-binding protein, partial [Turneriella sp.]|nr:ATP-binding protein [Turneriella sp.]